MLRISVLTGFCVVAAAALVPSAWELRTDGDQQSTQKQKQQQQAESRAARASQKKDAANNRSRTTKTSTRPGAPVRKPEAMSDTDRVEALAFARAHHPELVGLVNSLKRKRPAEYQRALRDLHTAHERLKRLEGTARYEGALTMWKLDSRIRLLLARWTVSSSRGLESQIRAALEERNRVRRAQLEQDRQKLTERLTRLNDSIEALDAPDAADAEWVRLTRPLEKRRAAAERRREQNARAAANRAKNKPSENSKSDAGSRESSGTSARGRNKSESRAADGR